jgi:hypothetical protein
MGKCHSLESKSGAIDGHQLAVRLCSFLPHLANDSGVSDQRWRFRGKCCGKDRGLFLAGWLGIDGDRIALVVQCLSVLLTISKGRLGEEMQQSTPFYTPAPVKVSQQLPYATPAAKSVKFEDTRIDNRRQSAPNEQPQQLGCSTSSSSVVPRVAARSSLSTAPFPSTPQPQQQAVASSSTLSRSHSAPSFPAASAFAPKPPPPQHQHQPRPQAPPTGKPSPEYEMVPISRQALIKEERARMGRMLQTGLACAVVWSGAKALGLSIRWVSLFDQRHCQFTWMRSVASSLSLW